ncbi:MAG: tRNA pseudouridine(38-40) synthase TruA [bacterium]
MRNIKMVLEYDGTAYHGFQRQNNALSVQQVLESTLKGIIQEDVSLISSGRTDAGVHARGQVVNFQTASEIKPFKLMLGLNSRLPEDIVIKNVEEVSLDFHARYSAKEKTYYYYIWNNQFPPALGRNYFYFFPRALDLPRMQQALSYFQGEHDFFAFCSKKTRTLNFKRNIFSVSLEEKNSGILKFSVTANGFLYNMVRMIVGFVVEIGSRNLEPEIVLDFLDNPVRKKTTYVAPAQGLVLANVSY